MVVRAPTYGEERFVQRRAGDGAERCRHEDRPESDSVRLREAAPRARRPETERINRGDGTGFRCETDPLATEYAGMKIALACCDATTCTREDPSGDCYAGYLKELSDFAPKDW